MTIVKMEQDFKVGDVVNFSWNSKYGKLIKFNNYIMYGYSEDNKWTHSSLISQIKGNDITIHEALSEGFQQRTLPKSQFLRWIDNGTITVGRPKYKLINVKKVCDSHIGTPYGWFDIVRVGLYTIFRHFSLPMTKRTKQLICSEAVALILFECSKGKINLEEEFDKPQDLITPIDLRYSKYIDWK